MRNRKTKALNRQPARSSHPFRVRPFEIVFYHLCKGEIIFEDMVLLADLCITTTQALESDTHGALEDVLEDHGFEMIELRAQREIACRGTLANNLAHNIIPLGKEGHPVFEHLLFFIAEILPVCLHILGFDAGHCQSAGRIFASEDCSLLLP